MLIIFRWWYFAGIAGLVLTVKGGHELSLAAKVAEQPVAVRLADLEQGVAPDQPFVRLDDHYAVFERAVYSERKGRIEELVYPIVSAQHPWSLQWDDLMRRFGDVAEVPKREVPQLEPLVFVTTSRFEHEREVPGGCEQSGDIGILARYDELSGRTRKLVDRLVPRQKARVFVIELGRTPMSGLASLSMLLGGISLLCWAIGRFFRGKRPSERREPAQ